MKRKSDRLLKLEFLEARDVPTIYGVPWADPQHLTVSFAPDTTAIGGQTSQLNSLLGTNLTGPAWKNALLRAVETWASQGNVDVSYVADSGAAFGSAGPAQGDPRFGDIRFGATSLSNNELAVASPYEPQLGTWSGDIIFNTNAPFGDGTNNTYDLYTVALHEVGHAFGIDDNAAPSSAMYSGYLGVRTGLVPSDIANFQALYGARGQDAFDTTGASHSTSGKGERQSGDDGGGDGNNSWHENSAATTPVGNNTPATATVLSTGKKLSNVTVAGDLTTATDVDYYQFTAPKKGQTLVSLRTAGISLLAADLTVFDSNNNVVADISNSDPTQQGALSLTLNLQGGQNYFVRVQHTSGTAFGVGGYQLTVGDPSAGTPPVVAPKSDNHSQEADSPKVASDLTKVATTTLSQDHTQAAQSLTLSRTELYHFVLRAESDQDTAGVRMTIFDANGNAVDSIVALPGQTVSANVWLNQGAYRIVFAGGTRDGSPLQNLLVTLKLANASDPLDPYMINPTLTPTTSPTTMPPMVSMPPTNTIVPPPPPINMIPPPPPAVMPPPPIMMNPPPPPAVVPPPPIMMNPPPPPPPVYVSTNILGNTFLTITNPYSNPFWY